LFSNVQIASLILAAISVGQVFSEFKKLPEMNVSITYKFSFISQLCNGMNPEYISNTPDESNACVFVIISDCSRELLHLLSDIAITSLLVYCGNTW